MIVLCSNSQAIIFRGMDIDRGAWPDQASEPLAALFGNQPRTQAAELKIVSLSLSCLPDHNIPYLIVKSGTFCMMSVLSIHANAQPALKIALTWSTRFVGSWMLLLLSEVGKSCLALQTNNFAESFFYYETCGALQELRRSKALFLPPPNKHIGHHHHHFKPSLSSMSSS